MTNNLSINLGVRYDADWGATNPPWVHDTVIPIDNGRESRRLRLSRPGSAISTTSRRASASPTTSAGSNDLVIRGGTGLYYNTPVSNVTYSQQFYNNAIAAVFLPDGHRLHGESDPRRDGRGVSLGQRADAAAGADESSPTTT